LPWRAADNRLKWRRQATLKNNERDGLARHHDVEPEAFSVGDPMLMLASSTGFGAAFFTVILVVMASISDGPHVWLTTLEAARRARVGVKTIYRAIRDGTLRAAAVDGRRKYVMRPEWVDAWHEANAKPVELHRER
jgi:excisionase family DNA binding protein